MDYFKSGGVEVMDTSSDNAGVVKKAENGEKRRWGTQDGKVRKKRKASSAERNLRLKKYVRPRNALMCLNDLAKGAVYNVETGDGPTQPICVSVTVNKQKYKGFGLTKADAKNAAAEAALASFVQSPSSATDGTASEDSTPWAVLASFAMFKLFNEWRDSSIGASLGANPNLFGMPMVQDATLSQSKLRNNAQFTSAFQMATTGDKKMPPQADVFNAYLTPKETKGDKPILNPSKNIPDKAASMHPVMLLHQLRPSLVFVPSSVMRGDKKAFVLSCDIDNMTFVGEGVNVKKAKYDLAVKALDALFNIKSVHQQVN